MFWLFFTSVAGFSFFSLLWIWRISKTSSWLKKTVIKNDRTHNNVRFFVLIPVLDEADILSKTVEYFSKKLGSFNNSKIIIITTEKEYRTNLKKSPQDTVSLAKCLEEKYENIISLHYPYVKGKMAHQVNYAVKYVNNFFWVQKNDFFALYNADSRPDGRTFNWVENYLYSNEKHSPQVFQQYGNYFGNYSILSSKIISFLKRAILISASMWQNRWSAGFEIPHALDQFGKQRCSSSIFYPMNYCIGHGLFFSNTIYERMGGFSENIHNEDAIFGLKLSYRKEPIIPIPFFDNSHSPDSIKSLFFQKASWFFGPLQAFEYYFQIIKESPPVRRVRLLLFSIKLFSHAIFWIVGPSIFLFLCVYAVFVSSAMALTSLFFVIVIFFVIPNIYSWEVMRKNSKNCFPSLSSLLVYSFAGSVFFYIMHGLSAWFSLFRYCLYLAFGFSLKKSKTAMLYK